MLVTAYFLVWILTELRDYVILVYSGYPILCEWEMLDLINGTPIMENPNPIGDPLWIDATRYEEMQTLHEEVHWYLYIPYSSVSELIR